jgi:hypothetical protein
MKGDSGVVLAGRLLIKTAPSFYNSTGVPKQELARTLNAISINLGEMAQSLRLGVLPVQSLAKLRAKTITLIIVGREVVPEEVAREIARHSVSCTRFPILFDDGHRSIGAASEYETVSKLFKNVSERLAL